MSENELNDTQPNPVKPENELKATQPNPVESGNELKDTQPNPIMKEPSGTVRKNFPRLVAVLVLVLLVVVGLLGGYGSGMGRRISAQGTLVSGQLQEQYQLGVEAVKAGEYEIAKQHFEFIIQHNPEFPGVQSAYTNLLVQMMITPSPTITLTPTLTPTPDMRSVDEIYNNIVALLSAPGADLCGRDWNGVISKLDALRKADITYHAAEVDGMYYISLRNRGICKIYPQAYESNASCQDLNINLEGGIYDLTLAESFGPLDTTADGLRTWARIYIAGASFWDQDWVQVKNYFSQVMASVPHLADSTCTTATERWRLASIGYAEQLMAKGDYCGADQQFLEAFSINNPNNATVYPTATAVRNRCVGNNGIPTKSNKTRTPTLRAPTKTPTPRAPTKAPTKTAKP
jgi:hypothetical protein